MLGPARLAPYLEAADYDAAKAKNLYLWTTDLAGALHSTISFVEIAVRNAISEQLSIWNTQQGQDYNEDWALGGSTGPLLYEIVGPKALKNAQNNALREALRRKEGHRRFGEGVTNDDVIAQLMFGTWTKIISPITGSSKNQQMLWEDGVRYAFPNMQQDDDGRQMLGRRLERIRSLRNRVAHHDNLLKVEVENRLNDILSILSKINKDFPAIAMARSRVRATARQDPRRAGYSWAPLEV